METGGARLALAPVPAADGAVARPPPPKEADPLRRDAEHNTNAFDRIEDNPFLAARDNPLSTFAVNVDTASYAIVRRFLTGRQLPPKGAVRIEDLVNYFPYRYDPPTDGSAFAVRVESAACPWEPKHRLVRIGLKGREIAAAKRPASNLVFLVDVSGSMGPEDRLPLVQRALRLLVDQLDERDRVAVVVYASDCGVRLPSTAADDAGKRKLIAAIDGLSAGGSTNGGSGINLAYEEATKGFVKGGVNRVILCTDGDFNVGVTDRDSLTRLIEDKARGGVSLSLLGVGMGNLKDGTMEALSKHGHGNYAYVDTLNEARKVLVEQMTGTLVTIAKDVKVQVDFNPARVSAYRLLGYENRLLRAEDFNNDKKDGGDIGAGHTVTALYEIVPAGAGVALDLPRADPSKYAKPEDKPAPAPAPAAVPANASEEMLTVRLRHKLPEADTSTRQDVPFIDRGGRITEASEDFRFAAAVAEFGLLLRDSPHKGRATWESVLSLAESALGDDRFGYRKEFLGLAGTASGIAVSR
jgi:secreted protein with Ig-like and vWFA domain